jgi:hypothetical protein
MSDHDPKAQPLDLEVVVDELEDVAGGIDSGDNIQSNCTCI